MFSAKETIVGLLLMALSIVIVMSNDYTENKERPATLVYKTYLEPSGKSSMIRPVFVYELENGDRIDSCVSVATWTSFSVGDRMLIKLADSEITPVVWKNLLFILTPIILLALGGAAVFVNLVAWLLFTNRN